MNTIRSAMIAVYDQTILEGFPLVQVMGPEYADVLKHKAMSAALLCLAEKWSEDDGLTECLAETVNYGSYRLLAWSAFVEKLRVFLNAVAE